MSNFGLKCCSCLCACLLVTVNNFAILVGLLLFALGLVFTVGLNWLSSNDSVQDWLKTISDLLKSQTGQEIEIQQLLSSIGQLTGSVGAAFIVAGVVILAVACLGCIGGCCKIRQCLLIYAIIVGLVFLGQLIVVIIWYANSEILKASAKSAMEQSVAKYKGFRSTNLESLLQNMLQILVGCCGVNNGTDFENLSQDWDRQHFISQGGRNFTFNLTYPVTCCKFDLARMEPLNLYCPYNNTDSNYRIGCYDTLFTGYIDKYFLNYLFPALAGLLVLQLLLVVGSLVIYSSESSNKNQVAPQRSRAV
ncbi:hypothetical protein BOX15_Mlig013070g1 [Macrostomum lignano]|uniref:Uncharacterized protein n=2 Tax=Macrostomum lignano TaxID=282301 RepID=A0A267EF41_9PLAT|nr:hypothetical protein BOX15_Mlig013070g1 [Macrostomum lignano]